MFYIDEQITYLILSDLHIHVSYSPPKVKLKNIHEPDLFSTVMTHRSQGSESSTEISTFIVFSLLASI